MNLGDDLSLEELQEAAAEQRELQQAERDRAILRGEHVITVREMTRSEQIALESIASDAPYSAAAEEYNPYGTTVRPWDL